MPRSRSQAIDAAVDARSKVEAAGSTYQPIGSPVGAGGLQLWAVTRGGGRKLTTIRDSSGNTVPSSVVSRTVGATKTCWKCGKDTSGNTHCWVIPCPIRAPLGNTPVIGGGGGPVIR